MEHLIPLFETMNDIEQESIVESENSNKKYYLKGIYTQCDIKNSNGRIYPFNTVKKQVENLQSKISSNVAFGEFGHPKTINELSEITPFRVSHRIVEINEDGKNFIGKAILIPEGLGKTAIAMIDTGGVLSVSSRGVGTVNKNTGIVENNYKMYTYDLVFNPGMKSANQTAILENKELFVNEMGYLTEEEWQKVEKNRKNLNAILFKYDLFTTINKLKKL